MTYLKFGLDKAVNAINEALPIEKAGNWYLAQGKRVRVRYNGENGLQAMRGYDLIDSFGLRWEVKTDKIALTSGRIFVSQSLRTKSTADMVIYLISPGGGRKRGKKVVERR